MVPATTTDTIIIEPAAYAILPTGGGFEFEPDAEFFMDYDDAMDAALG